MNKNPMSLVLLVLIAVMVMCFVTGSDFRFWSIGLVGVGLALWVFMAHVTVGPAVLAMADLNRHYPSDEDL